MSRVESSAVAPRPAIRWLQLVAGIICMVMIANLQYGWTLFVSPIDEKYHWGRAAIQVAFTLFILTETWLVPVEGWLVDRFGPKIVVFVGGVLVAIAWAMNSAAHTLTTLYVAAAIGGIGAGGVYGTCIGNALKWFPDHRGMATGFAIAGFGGGAMIGAPLANLLMNYFKTPTSVGVWETFVTMGVIYFVFMMIGAFAYRVTPAGWQPDGWTPPSEKKTMITEHNVHLNDAHKTPQFWLIWWVLCLNVSAGIGVIGMASPMLQEIFAGKLIGMPNLAFGQLSVDQKTAIAAIAAGFAGLLSLFNIGGRFFWASLSDYIGRKNTYYTFFLLGIALYALAPTFANTGNKLLFVLGFGIILSMYGGGFATVPAYLADMFGTQFVGAIHGRLLTAWSTAGIIGPVVVNYLREFQLAAGVPRDKLYDSTMYVLCAMLAAGLICNFLIKPVNSKWYMSEVEVKKLQAASAKSEAAIQHGSFGIGKGGLDLRAVLFWLFVGVPLGWGVYQTLLSAAKIF